MAKIKAAASVSIEFGADHSVAIVNPIQQVSPGASKKKYRPSDLIGSHSCKNHSA